MKRKLPCIVMILGVLLCSCNKQSTPSIDKLFILEYNYEINDKGSASPSLKVKIIGFSEMDKQLKLRYARRAFWNSPDYCNLDTVIEASIGNKIIEIVSNYQRDTTFLYTGEEGIRCYDGNDYAFIIQADTTIRKIHFEPKFLPDNLKFVYEYLYENREKAECHSKSKETFEMFENIIPKKLPSPPLKRIMKFTPPKIENTN